MTAIKEQTFLERIVFALGMRWWEVAKAIGIRSKDMKELMHERHTVAGIDEDEAWWKLAELIDKRIALLLAAKQELNTALQRDRARRAAQLERSAARPKRYPPKRPE